MLVIVGVTEHRAGDVGVGSEGCLKPRRGATRDGSFDADARQRGVDGLLEARRRDPCEVTATPCSHAARLARQEPGAACLLGSSRRCAVRLRRRPPHAIGRWGIDAGGRLVACDVSLVLPWAAVSVVTSVVSVRSVGGRAEPGSRFLGSPVRCSVVTDGVPVRSESSIDADVILGTSVGAINGALFAADPTVAGVERLSELWVDSNFAELSTGSVLRSVATLARTGTHLQSLTEVRGRLAAALPVRRVEELELPFQCVAASIEWAAEHWFEEGDLADVVLASCAVPGTLPPVKIGDEHFIDGGIVNSIPVARAVALGATTILRAAGRSAGEGRLRLLAGLGRSALSPSRWQGAIAAVAQGPQQRGPKGRGHHERAPASANRSAGALREIPTPTSSSPPRHRPRTWPPFLASSRARRRSGERSRLGCGCGRPPIAPESRRSSRRESTTAGSTSTSGSRSRARSPSQCRGSRRACPGPARSPRRTSVDAVRPRSVCERVVREQGGLSGVALVDRRR